MPNYNPFHKGDLTTFNNYATQLEQFMEELLQAKNVGVDLPHLEAEANNLRMLIAQFESQYFPQQTTLTGG